MTNSPLVLFKLHSMLCMSYNNTCLWEFIIKITAAYVPSGMISGLRTSPRKNFTHTHHIMASKSFPHYCRLVGESLVTSGIHSSMPGNVNVWYFWLSTVTKCLIGDRFAGNLRRRGAMWRHMRGNCFWAYSRLYYSSVFPICNLSNILCWETVLIYFQFDCIRVFD